MNADDGNFAEKQKIIAGIFLSGKMGDLVSILLIGGIEHALADFPRAIAILVECGKISLVPAAPDCLAAALAGIAGFSRRHWACALGGHSISRLKR